VRETRPDLVVIAGDFYDRAVPSPDAVRLLDDTLTGLTLDIDVPVLAISGNHDSEGFGSLDAESLELAQCCIIHLQQTGRMVGLLSLVEEMSSWTPRPRHHYQDTARQPEM